MEVLSLIAPERAQVQPWACTHTFQIVWDECDSVFRPDFLGVPLRSVYLIVHSKFNYRLFLSPNENFALS